MIRVFSSTDKNFTSNGDVVLRPLKAVVKCEDNGDYYLDLETDLKYSDYLVAGNIVVVDAPNGAQAFRISNPRKTGKKITIKAWHVFYDSQNYLIQDSYVVDKDCNDAIDHLNSATEPTSEFTTISDVATVNSFRCVRKSLYEAMQTVIERWGGHLVRDNFNIGIRAKTGQDNGVTIRYRKNLQDISVEENWDNVVTKLMPVGTDGILLNEIDQNASVYVVSDTQYTIPFTKTVSFQQDVDQEEFTDANGNVNEGAYKAALIDDLLQQATAYIESNCVPKVNYTLKAHLEKISDIGDTIQVIDERLGVNIMTNVISYEYDCILDKYKQIEFGNFKRTLSGFASGVNNRIDSTVNNQVVQMQATLSNEFQQATEQIISQNTESFTIYDGNQILVVDRLPKESAVNVLRINSGGIGFSSSGINGTFNSAWTIDGTLNMQAANVINLTASLIKGGTLKLGAHSNVSGSIELYDDVNNLIGLMDDNGLKMYGQDGSYVLLNNQVGFAGYDRNGNEIYWVNGDEFHMRKSVVEEEITLCNKLRFIPITITDSNSNITNDGIGLVSVGGE